MLDTVSKILERVLVTRLENALTNAGGLSPKQYGFCRLKSTIDADERVHQIAAKKSKVYGTKEYCLVVTIDVKNAFNSANWSRIMSSLRSFRVPWYLEDLIRNYFQERVLTKYNITGGVSQGSVLGPLLKNVMYDGILRLNLAANAEIIGFAGDIVLVAKSIPQIEALYNPVVDMIKNWLNEANGSAIMRLAIHLSSCNDVFLCFSSGIFSKAS